jgi:hypothetical protein
VDGGFKTLFNFQAIFFKDQELQKYKIMFVSSENHVFSVLFENCGDFEEEPAFDDFFKQFLPKERLKFAKVKITVFDIEFAMFAEGMILKSFFGGGNFLVDAKNNVSGPAFFGKEFFQTVFNPKISENSQVNFLLKNFLFFEKKMVFPVTESNFETKMEDIVSERKSKNSGNKKNQLFLLEFL